MLNAQTALQLRVAVADWGPSSAGGALALEKVLIALYVGEPHRQPFRDTFSGERNSETGPLDKLNRMYSGAVQAISIS